MRKQMKIVSIVLAVTTVLLLVTGAGAQLGSILKGAIVIALVNQFGDQINDGINTVLGNKGAAVEGATKVVPIFSAGKGAYLGAAQVAGPQDSVEKVKGVAQFEINLTGRSFRAEVFVPVSSIDISKLRRVGDVGVSANIDLKL